MSVDQGDLQGNVLCGYGFGHALYAFLDVRDPEAARAWLRGRLDAVTTARPWGPAKPESTLNVAFGAEGLRALGVGHHALAGFPADFRGGMAARAPDLGDTGRSAPDRWEAGLEREAHVVVVLTARSPQALDRARAEHVAGAPLALRAEQPAAVLAGEREHFGFRDGFGQPAIADPAAGPWEGSGTPRRCFGFRPVQPGEFVLGHRDEDGPAPVAPDDPYRASGTFMVLRKLAQDVALWRASLRRWGGDDPAAQEEVAAKVVGRWRDGRPLVRHPDRVAAPPSADELRRENRFRYRGDRDGRRCPMGAHIRRANPRDAIAGRGALSSRHRIIRRGMPYGPPYDADPGAERGLVFVCFQASIERQFEVIQRRWVADGDPFGCDSAPDLLLGPEDPEGRMLVPGDPPRFLMPQPALVTTRGGGYYFVPGLRALRAVAGSGAPRTSQTSGASASGA